MAGKRLRNETDEGELDKLAGKKQLKSIHEIAESVFSTAKILRIYRSVSGIEREKDRIFSVAGDNRVLAFVELLRKVVQEEMERGLFKASRSLPRFQAAETKVNNSPASLVLAFEKSLSLPIYTGSRIEDEEGNPLRIILVDTESGERFPLSPSSPLKVEIVAVDGDFPRMRENWTSEEFDRNIVKERAGKRPLIAGEVNLSLRGGSSTVGEISFTDNSSWIRSRHFRIGAKVAGGSHGGTRIREALTDAFVVKDHRGESYQKHFPPSPSDEVWRLKNIGKDGAYHKRLKAERIATVYDFLSLAILNPDQLRSILGPNMSDKTWEMTLAHAKTCEMHMNSFITPPRAQMSPEARGEMYEVLGRATLPQQGAMMPQFGYMGYSAMPSITFFPGDHETLINVANNTSGIGGQTINGSLEVQFPGNWVLDPPSDQDGEIFPDGR